MSLCASVFCALWSLARKWLTSWFSCVMSICVFVTFPLVYWVRWGTRFYRFLIFAPLLTLTKRISCEMHTPYEGELGTSPPRKKENIYFKVNAISIIIILDENMLLVVDKSK